MSIRSRLLEITAANIVVSGTGYLLFGPMYVGDMQAFAITIFNNNTAAALTISPRTCFNENGDGEVAYNIAGNVLDNSAVTVNPSGGFISFSPRYNLGHNYVTIWGSATATIGSSQVRCVLTGKIVD